MIIFLYGEDTYRLEEVKRGIVDKYRAKHSSGLNLFAIDGAENGAVDSLEEALKGVSFFAEIKLIVFKSILAGDKDRILAVFERYGIKDDAGITVLALHPDKLGQKQHALAKFLTDKNNLVRDFEPLSNARLAAWLKAEAAKRGTPFTASALKLFTEIGGKDSWERVNNLDKLTSFCRGPITDQAVLTLISRSESSNMFELIDAIGARRRSRAYDLLYRELSGGSEPHSILSMIAYQFRTMLTVKDLVQRGLNGSALAKEASLHPFVARKTAAAVSKYEISDLVRRFQSLQKLELAAKSGRIDLVDGLFALVLA